MKPINLNFKLRALAGLAAGLVLGGMQTSRAEDMYRPGGIIPGGVPASFNINAVVSGTNTTVSWYGPHAWYTVQATTNTSVTAPTLPVFCRIMVLQGRARAAVAMATNTSAMQKPFIPQHTAFLPVTRTTRPLP